SIGYLRNTELIELIDRSIQTGKTQRNEIFFDEKERLYRATAYPIVLESGINVIMILRDLTERRHMERVKRDFIANVSHELKTPITTIKGYIETLMDTVVEDKDKAREFLEITYRNVIRMERLVEDLINLTGIESGVIKIEKRDVLLKDVFDELIKEFGPKAQKKGLKLLVELDNEEAKIQADQLRLRQILGNLIDNAIKFTESGTVTIGLTHRDNTRVLFVQDTGIGIPKEYIPRLGERFFRVDPSRSRALGGTGLGLAIVKHLVMAHDWKMNIESQPGKGTRINILIDS
ncbi:MAG: PAS domain-containing sensor histidine kinase, partial [Nitrospirae bacterium]|nr:PAS domain-containing sensor histidine kinase [Nitrospirota bacterium]